MAGDYYMNIELGKEMFYKCYGNSFYIYMEFGKAYKKCKAPQRNMKLNGAKIFKVNSMKRLIILKERLDFHHI